MFGVTSFGDNSATATVKWRVAGSEVWSAETPITSGVSVVIGGGSLAVEKQYDVLYAVTDKLITRTFAGYISKAEYLLELSKNGDAIGLLTTYGAEGTVTVRAGAVLQNGTDPYVKASDASSMLTAIKTVDGTGSGLDADTIDGTHLSSLLKVQLVSNSNANDFPVWTFNLGTNNSNAPTSGYWMIMTFGADGNYVQLAMWIYNGVLK